MSGRRRRRLCAAYKGLLRASSRTMNARLVLQRNRGTSAPANYRQCSCELIRRWCSWIILCSQLKGPASLSRHRPRGKPGERLAAIAVLQKALELVPSKPKGNNDTLVHCSCILDSRRLCCERACLISQPACSICGFGPLKDACYVEPVGIQYSRTSA